MDQFIYKNSTYPYSTGRVVSPMSNGDIKRNVKSPQTIHDSWRGTDRTCCYMGTCASCGRMTYAFDDGENDPRGVLGDNAADPIYLSEHVAMDDAAKVKAVGDALSHDVVVPACFCCTNDYDRYQYLLSMATRRARKMGADI